MNSMVKPIVEALEKVYDDGKNKQWAVVKVVFYINRYVDTNEVKDYSDKNR